MHPSWNVIHGIPNLDHSSSRLRWHIAYPILCQKLNLQKKFPSGLLTIEIAMIDKISKNPLQYIETAGSCFLVNQENEDSLKKLSDNGINFSKKTCKSLSLDRRHQSGINFTMKEIGLYLLYRYSMNIHEQLWERVKLMADTSLLNRFYPDEQEAIFNLNAGVINILWKMVDQYLTTSEEHTIV